MNMWERYLHEFRTFGSLTPGGLGFQPGDPGEVHQKCETRNLEKLVQEKRELMVFCEEF